MSRLLAVLSLAVLASLAAANLVNENVEREINLETHLVTITTTITVKNAGSATVTGYKLAHDDELAEHLAFVAATDDSENELAVTGNTVDVVIPAGQTKTLHIQAVYTHAQAPFPAKITQTEKQLVLVKFNAYMTSPYGSSKQKTVVKLAGSLESHTKHKPSSTSDKTVTYGPYSDVEAGTKAPVQVHFQSSTPFLTVTNIEREIVVSHWGYVFVTENIDLLHSGAELKGPFSRLDYQRNPMASQNAIASFTTKLPAAAESVYYRDVIGNISTSNMRSEEDAVVLEIQPRFPLFGSWKTQYTIGYVLPVHEVLASSGGDYELSAKFIGHIYDNQVVDQAEVRIVLPEGATNIDVSAPFPVEQSEDVKVTYLDTAGRPVVVLKKSNLVEEHMQEITVSYHFSSIMLIREPAMVVLFCMALFLAAILLNRIDVTIDPKKDQ